jgi:glucosamine--fructose-6-phosphate aminotransferase (isomerizing)
MIKRNKTASVPKEEDCFTKMERSFAEAGKPTLCNFGVLHSRYSSSKLIKDNLAHPHLDQNSRVAIFHNGFIANYEDLASQLHAAHGIKIETDSQLIAMLIGKELDEGLDVKTAIKNVVERKLMGTWKLAVMPLDKPDHLYFVKNSGEIIIGQLLEQKAVIVSTEEVLFKESPELAGIKYEKIPNNFLVDLKDDCSMTMEKLEKKIVVVRQPHAKFEHIFQEEVYGAAEAVNNAIDFGQKFISNH